MCPSLHLCRSLYVVDGMIAGRTERTSFRLIKIAADVCLPCEENYELRVRLYLILAPMD